MVSAIKLHESAISIYIYPLPGEPPPCLPILPIEVETEHEAELPEFPATSYQWTILNTVVCKFQCYSLFVAHSPSFAQDTEAT